MYTIWNGQDEPSPDTEVTKEPETDHAIVEVFCNWMPRLIILHMPVILMMRPMANPPAVVWDQNGCVCDIAHKVIECFVVGEASVTAANRKQASALA